MTDRDDTRSNLDPRKDDGNVAGNLVGEGVGGASGIAAGAALGSLGGPVGTVIGALAGAVGGWWAGRSVSESVHDYKDDDDTHYRTHHTSLGGTAARDYDDVRPAYQLGHLAGRNPEYAGRGFDEVETDLQRGWTGDVAAKHGDWTAVRPYARTAYDRGRAGGTGAGAVGTAASATRGVADRVADAVDDLKDRVDGNPASRPGRDSTDNPRR
jgi:outer membrane lipoprotein SlyB